MDRYKFPENSFRLSNAFLKTGAIASARYELVLDLEVIQLDENVFIIGTTDPNGALFTRESMNSYTTADEAHRAIETGDFEQNLGYAEAPIFAQTEKPYKAVGPVMVGEALIGPHPHPNGGVE